MSEEIPKKGLGGVVVNEGPDFYVEVRDDLDVPEPSKCEKTTINVARLTRLLRRG